MQVGPKQLSPVNLIRFRFGYNRMGIQLVETMNIVLSSFRYIIYVCRFLLNFPKSRSLFYRTVGPMISISLACGFLPYTAAFFITISIKTLKGSHDRVFPEASYCSKVFLDIPSNLHYGFSIHQCKVKSNA